jgi:hypothetical protein
VSNAKRKGTMSKLTGKELCLRLGAPPIDVDTVILGPLAMYDQAGMGRMPGYMVAFGTACGEHHLTGMFVLRPTLDKEGHELRKAILQELTDACFNTLDCQDEEEFAGLYAQVFPCEHSLRLRTTFEETRSEV